MHIKHKVYLFIQKFLKSAICMHSGKTNPSNKMRMAQYLSLSNIDLLAFGITVSSMVLHPIMSLPG